MIIDLLIGNIDVNRKFDNGPLLASIEKTKIKGNVQE